MARSKVSPHSFLICLFLSDGFACPPACTQDGSLEPHPGIGTQGEHDHEVIILLPINKLIAAQRSGAKLFIYSYSI